MSSFSVSDFQFNIIFIIQLYVFGYDYFESVNPKTGDFGFKLSAFCIKLSAKRL